MSLTSLYCVGNKIQNRKNAWGYCSYADLITMALQRAPSKQMTLAEIYDWIVANIPFFKDKGDANSSVGWKNSIRHNLSLHDKFSRVTPTNATKVCPDLLFQILTL